MKHTELAFVELCQAVRAQNQMRIGGNFGLTSSMPPTPEKSQREFTAAAAEIEQAVSGLRRAGRQDYLPPGLLTRAWLRGLTGPRTGPESAQSDLDEAWEIAERGPMPLFRADIHLYRARLFFREAQYPWDKHPDGTPRGPKDDFTAARAIICRETVYQKDGVTLKHSYLRRLPELEDAEDALKRFEEERSERESSREV